MFFSSMPPNELPNKADLVRFNNKGPYTVTRRTRSTETGSVFLNLQHHDEIIDLVPVEACEWWPQIGAIVVVATGALEKHLVKAMDVDSVSKRIRLFCSTLDPYFEKKGDGKAAQDFADQVRQMRPLLDKKLVVTRIINGDARCRTFKDDEPLPYALPVDCLKVVSLQREAVSNG